MQTVVDRIYEEKGQLKQRNSELDNILNTLQHVFGGEVVPIKGKIGRPKREMSADARERIAEAQRARWREQKRSERKNGKTNEHSHSSNGQQPRWTPEDEKVIVSTLKAKSQPQDAPEFARSLLKKFPTRTEGAIRQRLIRMVDAGVLKAHMNGKGAVPHQMVEVA